MFPVREQQRSEEKESSGTAVESFTVFRAEEVAVKALQLPNLQIHFLGMGKNNESIGMNSNISKIVKEEYTAPKGKGRKNTFGKTKS